MPPPHRLPRLLTLVLNFTEKIKALKRLPPHAPRYISPTSSLCTHTLLPPVTGGDLAVLLSEADLSICAGPPLHLLANKDFLPPSRVPIFSLLSWTIPICARAHTCSYFPVFKNTSLTPLASLIATLFICPLYRKPPKAVLDPSLVPRLPFLPEPALIRLLFPHSTKTAIRNAPRSSLWPNPQTLCR